MLPTTVCDCSVADCSVHRDILDSYAKKLYLVYLTVLIFAFPHIASPPLADLLGGRTQLISISIQQIFGISCGMNVVAHLLVFYFN